jgi:hypothetical protein
MKIVDIREIVVPIKSEIRNAYIDFSQMAVPLSVSVSIPMDDTLPAVFCVTVSFHD